MIKDNQNDKVHPASWEERQIKIAEILAEGVYSYLKGNGQLKEDFKKEKKVQELLERIKGIDTPISNGEV